MESERIIAQRYRLGRKLGEGGMGTVYFAEHVTTGRKLAVKVLEQREKLPKEAVDRFDREARAPAAIGHPNIVEVIDAGTEPDGTPFLAMELLEGETLDEVIRRDRVVQPPTLAVIMEQLLDALDAMHARGFVHRDLKPANIFLCRTSTAPLRVKVLDFGIAKALGEETRTKSGYVIGTPAYMAPEQMRNARSATPRSDLWSVGVMLYEALAGHRPFRGETFGLLAQITGPAPHMQLAKIAPHLPEALTTLVDALLDKDASARPTSAAEVRERLGPALARAPAVFAIAPTDDEEPPFEAPIEHAATQARRAEPSWRDGPLPSAAREPEEPAPSPSIERAPERRPDVGWRVGVAAVALIVAASVVALAMGSGHPSGGAHTGGGNASGDPSSIGTPIADNAELSALVHQWAGTLVASHGTASLSNYYVDAAHFRSAPGLLSPGAVQRAWSGVFADGGSFSVDWSRTRYIDIAPTLPHASAACINAAGATGRLYEVRAWSTEGGEGRGALAGCHRLEGIYLVQVRRVAGSLRICNEAWSTREGICASCPDAPACRAGNP